MKEMSNIVFPIVISPEYRMRQHRDKDHQEDAHHFKLSKLLVNWKNIIISKVVEYGTSFHVIVHMGQPMFGTSNFGTE